MIRIIPCLDVLDGRVVKGVKFVNLRDALDPAEAASAYERAGADELVFLDIAATVENRPTRLEWVRLVKEKISLPFTVGGGIGSLSDMERLFALGVTRVSINTAAVRNPDLIDQARKRFGSEKIVVAIDGIKNETQPRLEVVVSGGHEKTGLDIVAWAKEVQKRGAGEILLTSKDADGTKKGYDIEMTRAVAESVSIPVTASGGAGSLEDLYEAVVEGHAQAVLAASIFHFGEISIPEAKEYLAGRGIAVKNL